MSDAADCPTGGLIFPTNRRSEERRWSTQQRGPSHQPQGQPPLSAQRPSPDSSPSRQLGLAAFFRAVRAAPFVSLTAACTNAPVSASGPTSVTVVTPEDAGQALVDAPSGPGIVPADGGDSVDAGGATEAGDLGTSPAVLASLTVSPLALVPAFSPSTHDYAVRCAAGPNPITIAMAAGPGAVVDLVPSTGATATTSSVDLSLNPDQAAVIQVTAGAATAQYWIRCLPPDFPTITVTTYPAAGAPTPGWYLLSQSFTRNAVGNFAMILDANGVPVWYRREPQPVYNVEVRAMDAVSFIVDTVPAGFGTDTSATYQVDNLANDTVAAIPLPIEDGPTDVHEFRTLANGDYLVISTPLVSGVDLTGLAVAGIDGGAGSDATIDDCVLRELDPSGVVVWSWDALDHIDPVAESTYPATVPLNGETVFDVFHCNSVDEAASSIAGAVAGDLLVSARHLDAVFLISKATGSIVWKLSGAPSNKDGAKIIATTADGAFYRQHDARFLPNGQISLFDDQTSMPGPARGIAYALDLDRRLAEITWQYAGPASSLAMGSTRIGADGDAIIGWGLPSAGSLVFSEVNAANADVLDVSFDSATSYRAVKAPPGAFDLATLRNTAGE